jgi:hypothetical protein
VPGHDVRSGLGYLAAADATRLAASTQAECLRELEQAAAPSWRNPRSRAGAARDPRPGELQLGISKRTVDAHLEHIFGKLGIFSRVRLATQLSPAEPSPERSPPPPGPPGP